jgi:hypothetical protein
MKRWMMAALATGLALTSMLSGSRVILAEETTCWNFLGAVTVDNLLVPQNASCTLDGTRVEGTIKVENGASLTAKRVTVIGNIQAVGANVVKVLAGSSVGGSIQIKQGGAARVDQVHVNGDIQFESNHGAVSATRSRVGGNLVGGNVQIFQNTGSINIVENSIDGNLQCKENDPPPTGRDNVVQGNAEDQCAHLVPGDTTPPDTTILTGPPDATFTFTGSDNATPKLLLLFECALDGAAFEACDSPHDVRGLAGGEHRLQVRGLDLALNADPTPANYTWTNETWRLCLPHVMGNYTSGKE